MTIKTTLFAVLFAPIISYSQFTIEEINEVANTASEQKLVVDASRILQADFYHFAEVLVDKLLTIKPDSPNYNYRKGFILLNSKNDYQTAIKHLEIAKTDVSKNYDMFSSKETSSPTDVYYHLGKCYHLAGDFDKAIEHYNLFISNSKPSSELYNYAQLGIEQCNIAKQMVANPKSSKIRNLSSPVNTEYPEYSPVISLDGKSLYFTARKPWEDDITEIYRDSKLNQYPEDIYISVLNPDNTWGEPKRLDFCDPKNNEATIAVSINEKRIYTYQDITGGGDIYFTDSKKDEFGNLEPLDIKGINSDYWETHCTVTPDGKNIYFTSDRPGGYGGRDIYRVSKMADGSWSEPQNLGTNINTPYDEDSPFIMIDNKTMYFASNGPKSMGGFDIFVTIRDENNNWSTPINLGYPINSSGDDLYYTTTANGSHGYLSSFREDGKGEKDIYEIENEDTKIQNVIVLNGNIHTLESAQLPEDAHVLLKCSTCNEKEVKLPLRTRDGAFISILEPCNNYEIVYMKNQNEVISSEKFKTTCSNEYEEIKKEIFYGEYNLSGVIIDKETKNPVSNLTVNIADATTGKVVETLVTDVNGNFQSKLLENKKFGEELNYVFNVQGNDYLAISKSTTIKLGNIGSIKETITVEKVEVGKDIAKMIDINPIYFDLDKYDIRPDAKIELDKIVKIMNDNPTIKIELSSHTDCRASKAYNLHLSDQRAKASAAYIKERIKNPSRIYGKGYGESKLVNNCGCEGDIVSDCSEEEHQANRRTEFRIVKK